MAYEDIPFIRFGSTPLFIRWIGIVAPHGSTTRLDVYSGTEELIIVRRILLLIRRVSAPTTYGVAYLNAYLQSGSDTCRMGVVYALQGDPYARDVFVDYPNIPLVSGMHLYVESADSSTGGSVLYDASILVERVS